MFPFVNKASHPSIPSTLLTKMVAEVPDSLLTFVTESTAAFDSSHNVEHALIVTNSTHLIMQSLPSIYETELVTYMAMLHDVCDHKYGDQSITREELEAFIAKSLPNDWKRVLEVIDNVSYSKQVKGLRKALPEPDATYLKALSDADRLEALGAIGIERCTTFTRERGGRVPEDVILHCHEKLLRLLPHGFIETDLARELAQPLHQEIVHYVETHS